MPRELARQRVAGSQEAAAALVIPEQTSKRYLGERPSTLILWTDPAKGSELQIIRALLLLAERDAAAATDPFHLDLLAIEEENLTGSRLSTTSVEQNVPGFSIMFVLMSLLFGLSFGLRAERDEGTWARLEIAPVGGGQILAGKLLARIVVAWVQMAILFGFGALRYGLHLGGPVTFSLLSLAVVWALAGFSLLIAVLPRGREQIIPLGLTAIMIVCSLGGCWWPLFIEPPWLQQLAHAFPTTWAMEGFHDVILRERGTLDILPALGVLFAYGAVCLAAGARLYRLDRV